MDNYTTRITPNLISQRQDASEKTVPSCPGGEDIPREIGRAVEYHRSGDISAAEKIYKRILGYNPYNSDAQHLLGLIAHQQGKTRDAVALIKKAIQNSPDTIQYHCSLGKCFQDLGQLDDGLACYRRALEIDPGCLDAYNNMGNALSQAGRIEDSIVCFRQALSINPACYQVVNNLGVSFQQQNELNQALNCYRKAIEIKSDYAAAHYNMGNILSCQGKLADAIACYKKALEHNPSYVKAINNMGNALKSLGRFAEAIDCYRQVLDISPEQADAYNNLGVAFMEQTRVQEAIASYRKALEIRPDYAEAFCNMAVALKDAGQLVAAIACLRRALLIDPEYDQAYNNLGNAYEETGRIDEALVCYRKALEIKPDYSEARSNMLLAMNYAINIDQQTLFSESRAWWRPCNLPVTKNRHQENLSGAVKRLKIGYVSPDFRRHAVSNFIIPLLATHDRNTVEVYCYAEVRRPDNITERIKNLADHWRSTVGKTDDAVADMIRQDRIAILIDLAGHTAGNRLQVFARKPAPVQVSWLGYPNTTGLPLMDYRLTDDIADPPGIADRLHSETLYRLPNGFLCYSPCEGAPEITAPKSAENMAVTFGCFNNLTKINKNVISVWAKILLGVPDSCLLVKNKQLADKTLKDHFLNRFIQEGIPASRIVILAPTPTFMEHLELYNMVDIGLDPFPYNGTTSTCEALWMGVPVISLCGDRHASRVGASILNRIDLGELVAESESEYIAKAIALATDRRRLKKIKTQVYVAFKESPLCDYRSFARELEKAFRDMWQRWCAAAPMHETSCDSAENKISSGVFPGRGQLPAGLKTEDRRTQIETQVHGFPFWYHKISLPYGITTPGWAPLNPAEYRIPDRLDGKRILDVGAWDGYWSFEALRRGAREVLAIDDFSDYLGQLKSSDRQAWDTFDFCRRILGYDSSKCQRRELSIYAMDEASCGRFDIVFFFGTLYHLRYPLLALDRLAAICDGEIFVESAILDDFSPYQGGVGHGYSGKQMVMEFYPENQYGNNDSNWWVPSLHCLSKMLKAAGFQDCRSWKLTDSPQSLPLCRGFVHAKKIAG